MMKRYVTLFFVLVACSMIFAASSGAGDNQGGMQDNATGAGIQNGSMGQDVETNQNVGDNSSIEDNSAVGDDQNASDVAVQEREQLRSQEKNKTQQRIRERAQELDNELNQTPSNVRNVYQNQNQVRLAVHALLAMENLTGGIGKNVSAIAREFNNSVQATIQAEERIQTRGGLTRFFFGGDENAAKDLENQTAQNQVRIRDLNQLRNQCDCDNETRAMMQEQIQQMEQEQVRLNQLANTEKAEKGLLGWIFK